MTDQLTLDASLIIVELKVQDHLTLDASLIIVEIGDEEEIVSTDSIYGPPVQCM